MNRDEAEQILLLYRPGTPDAEELQVRQALELAEHDAELGRWLAQHKAFQAAMRTKLRQIPVPLDLRARLLTAGTILRPKAWWLQPVWLAAAAALVLCLGLAGFWLKRPVPDRFTNFQSRMVGTALRQYRMDLVTKDMGQLRQFMAARGAPADYQLTPGLERLQLTGGGLLRWRSHPVAMVCFDRGDEQMLFLFVMDRSAVKDPPPESPQLATLNDLTTASWSQGGKTYVLAGPPDQDFRRKYL